MSHSVYDPPPVAAYDMFKSRYAKAKSNLKPGEKVKASDIAYSVASDYLNAYPDCGWVFGALMRAILRTASHNSAAKRKSKSVAKTKVRRDLGGQQYLGL